MFGCWLLKLMIWNLKKLTRLIKNVNNVNKIDRKTDRNIK